MKNKVVKNSVAIVIMVVLSLGIIACMNLGKEKAPKQEVIEVSSYTNESAEVRSAAKLLGGGDEVTGYVVTVAAQGFTPDSPIVMEVTFDLDKTTMIGFEVIEQNETVGLGANITEDSFKSQMAGLAAPVSTADMEPATSSFDQVTGATFSSVGVANGINVAYDFLTTVQ